MARCETPRFCILCGAPLRKPPDSAGEVPPFECSGCGYRVWEDPKLAVTVVVRFKEKIALLRRAQRDQGHGLWILPGGFVDRGEVVPEAARREAFEELGLDIELDGFIGVFSYKDDPVVVLAYQGKTDAEDLRINSEASEARFFSASEIPWDELGFASTKDILRFLFEEKPER